MIIKLVHIQLHLEQYKIGIIRQKNGFKERAVQEVDHPLHNVLLEQLKKIGNKKYVIHKFLAFIGY